MIPGAFDMRVGRPTGVTSQSAPPHARLPTLGDRERLEREEGGAPSERMAIRHRTLLARLWYSVFHPADLPIICATLGTIIGAIAGGGKGAAIGVPAMCRCLQSTGHTLTLITCFPFSSACRWSRLRQYAQRAPWSG
jgi:hypothetical protein